MLALLHRRIVTFIHQEKTQARKVIFELDLVGIEDTKVVHVSENLVRYSNTDFGMFHRFCMFLGLTQNGA